MARRRASEIGPPALGWIVMLHIIPRRESRTFGRSLGEADRRLASLSPQDVEDRDELYLLSPAVDENVKIRDEPMDIKALQQVNADGFEQWTPMMKAGFPLPAADVSKVFEALQVPAPSMARAAYTLEQFVEELVKPTGRVRMVAVHKKRARYRLDECAADLTEVATNGKRIRTVAIESEDLSRVTAAVRGLGLLGRVENVSYPKGLKRLVGMAS